jgi:hypothetical protein
MWGTSRPVSDNPVSQGLGGPAWCLKRILCSSSSPSTLPSSLNAKSGISTTNPMIVRSRRPLKLSPMIAGRLWAKDLSWNFPRMTSSSMSKQTSIAEHRTALNSMEYTSAFSLIGCGTCKRSAINKNFAKISAFTRAKLNR